MIKYKIYKEEENITENLINLPSVFFPNGERVYALPPLQSDDEIIFVLQYESDADLFALLALATCCPNTKHLYLPYLPYGRADRQVDIKLPTIKAMITLLNACKFEIIAIQEPHNAAAIVPYLETSVVCGVVLKHWEAIIEKENITHLCFPDEGSAIRYNKLIEEVGLPYITIIKKRDPVSGKITSMALENNPDLTGARVLIVDDICSKGGTFLGAGELLRQQNAENVFLYVNHCERTAYEGELLKSESPIDMVYTDRLSSYGLFNADKLTLLPEFVDKN